MPRVVAEGVEDVELVVRRWIEEVGALEDVDAARAAARAPARERDRRGRLVAEIDERAAVGGGQLDGRPRGGLEDDDGHF
jgi:hypothetical protein